MDRNTKFCRWLQSINKGGYVNAFMLLQQNQPEVFGWCSDQQLTQIFKGLPEMPNELADPDSLVSLFGGLFVSGERPQASELYVLWNSVDL